MSGHERVHVFAPAVRASDIAGWVEYLTSADGTATPLQFGATPTILATGDAPAHARPAHLPEPLAVVPTTGKSRYGRSDIRPDGTIVRIGPADIGDGAISVFAGPCAVETSEQLHDTVGVVRAAGAVGMRGGAFKPRTSPYDFQGLWWEGLAMLDEARERSGLPILTEVLDTRHVTEVAAVADGLQIGARNMQNFELLREVGASGKPVVLKRGFGCTVDEVLAAAEYILCQGNDQVVLCERGIRTFESATRFTLDISAVALFKQRTHLPVMVDPSHSAGIPSLVEPVAMAAVAAGADALLVDVHGRPESALCDGKQALLPADFEQLMGRLEMLAMGLGRKLAGVSAPMLQPTG